jgi:hypothetical protein
LNEYTTGFLATFAFLTLFPDGKGDPTNPCLQRDISFGNIIRHLSKTCSTLSSADLYWPELHSLFFSNVESLSMDEKRKNVIDNLHLISLLFFTRRLESFLKHWLYETLDAEWHWYRYEFKARTSIHGHGAAKLKSDPGLCKLTDIALKGFLAGKCFPCWQRSLFVEETSA